MPRRAYQVPMEDFMRSIGLVVAVAFVMTACKDENKSTTTTTASSTEAVTSAAAPTTTAATTAVATTQATATSVTVNPDMTAFMGMLDGKDGSSRKALKKYATPAMQTDDLGMYNLHDPKVTKADKSGDLQCYTMESEAGVMKHVTQVCWDAKGKISKITDTSS